MVEDMGASFDGFEWDEGNREKCAKHGVSPEEIESIFSSPLVSDIDVRHSIDEKRWYAVGALANGRHVFVVFTIRERDGARLIRAISARFMHEKEIRRYEATKQNAP